MALRSLRGDRRFGDLEQPDPAKQKKEAPPRQIGHLDEGGEINYGRTNTEEREAVAAKGATAFRESVLSQK
jgi:hypothetical protein